MGFGHNPFGRGFTDILQVLHDLGDLLTKSGSNDDECNWIENSVAPLCLHILGSQGYCFTACSGVSKQEPINADTPQ